jgi:hypothetical protein
LHWVILASGQLVKTDWSFTVNSGVIIPPPDSTIILNLKADKTYSYELNGAITSSGTFQIDTLLPATVEIKIAQLVPSSVIYLPQVIGVINDTLRISTLPTPAGITSYIYIRK